MDIKVFVATHKKYWMPGEKIYIPLHVGKAGSVDNGYLGDNTGDNISLKNKNYCELTGLYWIWKNIQCDYVGFCHYRRYFSKKNLFSIGQDKKKFILTSYQIDNYLNRYEIILPKKMIFEESVWHQYGKVHNIVDIKYVYELIKELQSEYVKDFQVVMAQHQMYCFNMFVMKKKLMDEYCAWLFSILFAFEVRKGVIGYSSYQARVYGFLAERLFNVWLHHRNLKIKELPILGVDEAYRGYWWDK